MRALPLPRASLWPVVALLALVLGCQPASSINERGGGLDPDEELPPLAASLRGPTVAAVLVAVSDPPLAEAQQYGLTSLRYAEADARELADCFHQLGVPVVNLFSLQGADATGRRLLGLLDDVSGQARPDDCLFVCFFGHGIGGQGQEAQLIASDGPVSLTVLLEKLGTLRAGKVVLVADACHSGSPGEPRFLPEAGVLRRPNGGLAWLASARADQSAYEAESLGHGVFTYHFGQVLRAADTFDGNKDGWLSFEEIAAPVRQRMRDWAGHAGRQQDPQYGLVGWQGDQRLLPARRQWDLAVLGRERQVEVRVRFPAGKVGSQERLHLIVCPRETPGRYWPQPHAVIGPNDGPTCRRMVYLGTEGPRDAEEEYRVCLVQADASTHAVFSRVPPDGLVSPALDSLIIRAEQTIRRER